MLVDKFIQFSDYLTAICRFAYFVNVELITFLGVVGMDAEVAYAFHSERENHPEKFKNQFTNQVGNDFFHSCYSSDFAQCSQLG